MTIRATINEEPGYGGKALVLAIIALFSNTVASAGSVIDFIRDYDLNDYSLGLAVSISQNPYEGATRSTWAYPYLTSFRHSAFTDDWLLIRNENFGVRFVTDNDWEFGAVGRVQTLGLGDGNLPGVEERDWAIEVAPLIGWRALPVHAQLRAYWEVPNRHSGVTGELELSLPREFSRGFFVPSATIKYMNSAYSRYYFGVAESEVAPERTPYEPGRALNYSAGLTLGYELTSKWLLKATVGIEFLDSSVSSSPLVDKDRLWSSSIGLAYNADLFQAKEHGDAIRPGTFVVRAAAFSSKISTDIRRDASDGNTGDDIDFESFLGSSGNETLLQTEVRYRVGFYHRLKGSFFQTDRNLEATLQQDFTFGDELFTEGTQVATRLYSRRFGLLYGYSLMRDAQKELGLQAGLVYSRFEIDVVAAETQQSERATVDAPLPTMGLFGSVVLGESWELGADIGVFALDVDRYSGYSGQASITLERPVGGSFALGIGFDYYVTRLQSTDEKLRGILRSRNFGPKLYLSWIF